MQLSIHAHGIDLTESLKRQTYQKLELALDRIEEQIRMISVYLEDTNGPYLGGVDKACRIVVQIQNQDSIVVEDCDESVDVVIDRATDRLGVVACQRWIRVAARASEFEAGLQAIRSMNLSFVTKNRRRQVNWDTSWYRQEHRRFDPSIPIFPTSLSI